MKTVLAIIALVAMMGLAVLLFGVVGEALRRLLDRLKHKPWKGL